jgi:hypothetical protein
MAPVLVLPDSCQMFSLAKLYPIEQSPRLGSLASAVGSKEQLEPEVPIQDKQDSGSALHCSVTVYLVERRVNIKRGGDMMVFPDSHLLV